MHAHDDQAASQLRSDSAFFPVRRDLIEQMRPSLRYSGLACFIYLCSHRIDNEEEWVTASASEIGRACKLKPRTVFSALAQLEKLGLIERNNAGTVNAYRLWPRAAVPDLAPAAPLAGSASSSESDSHTESAAQPPPEERSPTRADHGPAAGRSLQPTLRAFGITGLRRIKQ
jgi:hypothetical protein